MKPVAYPVRNPFADDSFPPADRLREELDALTAQSTGPLYQTLPPSPPSERSDADLLELATPRTQYRAEPLPRPSATHLAASEIAEYLCHPRGAWLVDKWVEKLLPMVKELANLPSFEDYLAKQPAYVVDFTVERALLLNSVVTGPWRETYGPILSDEAIERRLRLELPSHFLAELGRYARIETPSRAGMCTGEWLDLARFQSHLMAEEWRFSKASREELLSDLARVRDDLDKKPIAYSSVELRTQLVQSRLSIAEQAAWRFVSEQLRAGEGEPVRMEDGRHLVASARAQMSVLAEVRKKLATPDTFAEFSLRAVQHLLPDTAVLLEELSKSGLSRESTQLFGKSYSTNPAVATYLSETQWNQDSFSFREEPDQMRLDELKSALSHKPYALLLDDGGDLIREHARKNLSDPRCTVAVEQTMHGILKLRDVPLRFPVINVAECRVKKQIERILIGEGIVHNTLTWGTQLNAELFDKQPKQALVMGFGAVGSATAEALRRRGYAVSVFDPDEHARARAQAAGFHVGAREELLRGAHLVIGCTGRTSVSKADLDLLANEAIVVNGASGHSEIDVPKGAAHADEHEQIDGTGVRHTSFRGLDLALGAAHDHEKPDEHRVLTTSGNKRLLFLRGGGVVNLGKGMPPIYFQLVSGLLFGACVQATRSMGKAGLIPLDDDIQDFVEQRTNALLEKHGLSLRAPNFEQAAEVARTLYG